MSEADIPYAAAIGIIASLIGAIWGYRYASSSNTKSTTDPAAMDQLGEELSRTRGEYKDYCDTVDGEFGNINTSIRRLNASYAALLNNFVTGAEQLCPENKDALQIATIDRDLIAIGGGSSDVDETSKEDTSKRA